MKMEGKPVPVPIPDDRFNRVRDDAESFYKKLDTAPCPYLKEPVHFNTKGFEHIKFKSREHARNRFQQYARFKLIHLVPEVISRSYTVQGIWQTEVWEQQKSHGRWEQRLQPATYYEFVAVIGKARLKVIVKKDKTGPAYFWSLIPFWKMNEITKERRLHDGDPERD